MPPDLTKLSTADLQALEAGDLTKLSDAGLAVLESPQGTEEAPARIPNRFESASARTSNPIDQFILKHFSGVLSKAPDIQGSQVGRTIQGAADLPVGVMQLGASAVGLGEPANRRLSEVYREIERQRAEKGPDQLFTPFGAVTLPGNFDYSRLVGNLLNPVPMKFGGKLATATGIGRRMAASAAGSAAVGAASPVLSGENLSAEEYWASKGGQVLLSAVIGVAIPPAAELGKRAVTGIRNQLDLLLPNGASRILTRAQRKLVGEGNVPDVVAQLRRGNQELVRGSKPTAAEALVGLPEASPLQAHQEAIAQTKGGTSGMFGRRIKEQMEAVEREVEKIELDLAPVRKSVLRDANQQGGVSVSTMYRKAAALLKNPEVKASEAVEPAVQHVVKRLEKLTKKSGVNAGKIDARALYAVRKNIGNVLKKYADKEGIWDAGLMQKTERALQDTIDDAIGRASHGVGPRPTNMTWNHYLTEYHNRSAAVRADVARREAMYKPLQKTAMGAGAANIGEAERLHLPQMLTRPMMITNAALRKLGRSVETRIEPLQAGRYLHPEQLARALEQLPPAQRLLVLGDLATRGYIPALSAGISAGSREAEALR